MTAALRGTVAVAGAATAALGEAPGYSHREIAALAAAAALHDAGLEMADVDGLFPVSMHASFPAMEFAEYLNLRPCHVASSNVGGASAVLACLEAVLALQAGLCQVALVLYGSNQRSAEAALVAPPLQDVSVFERPYRPNYPVTGYALAAQRHMHDYGTTREQLAEVAVAARAWAQLNPEAFHKEPLTLAQVLDSRMVCDPLSVRDCCLVTDGGGALVLVRADRARDLAKPPVYFLGGAAAQGHAQVAMMPDLTATVAVESGRRAFAMAGLSPGQVDLAQIDDSFTIVPVMLLEDLGFCAKGEGGAFVSGGRIAPGGALALNTYGGGLSCTHPGMLGIFTVIEAVRQLRGQCGKRQAKDPKTALAHGNGGIFGCQVTTLWGTGAAL